MRILCKKLRYNLEFFADIFPGNTMAKVAKQLKRLQDILGSYNDFSQQIALLNRYLVDLQSEDNQHVLAASAGGGLIAQLHAKRDALLPGMLNRINNFCAATEKKRIFRTCCSEV